MLYIVSTTGRCNLDCSYCGGSMPEWMMPREVQYDLGALRGLVAQDPDAVVAFYGGEPLLRLDAMRAMMRDLPARRFVLQTNGTLLRSLSDEDLARLDTILVSLDGRARVTDAHRGRGVQARAMRGVERVRPRYRGDLVARMTVTEQGDIHEDVTHLLAAGFDHVHWQLNAVWAPEGSWRDFAGWIERSYNPGITRLAQAWLAGLEQGNVPGIAPFLGVLRRLRTGARGLACGAGRDAFAVTTDGWMLACPIGPEFEWNRLARLGEASAAGLRGRLDVGEPCARCDVLQACGGRCLFASRERAMNPEQFDLVCGTVRHLVRTMEAARPRVEALVAEGAIAESALDYPAFNNTIEVIP